MITQPFDFKIREIQKQQRRRRLRLRRRHLRWCFTGLYATRILSATQSYCNVGNIRNNIATMLQCCVAIEIVVDATAQHSVTMLEQRCNHSKQYSNNATLCCAKNRLCTDRLVTSQEIALLRTLSHLFHLVQFVKSWPIFFQLTSKRLFRSWGKETDRKSLSCIYVFNKTWNYEL